MGGNIKGGAGRDPNEEREGWDKGGKKGRDRGEEGKRKGGGKGGREEVSR